MAFPSRARRRLATTAGKYPVDWTVECLCLEPPKLFVNYYPRTGVLKTCRPIINAE
jgi:hypothetical protein